MRTRVIVLLVLAVSSGCIPSWSAVAGRDAFDVVGVDDHRRLSLYTSGGLGQCRPCQDPDDWKTTEVGACFNECLWDTLGLFVGCEDREVTFELSPLSPAERDIFATRLIAGSEVTLALGSLQMSTVITTMAFSVRGYDGNWSMHLRAGHSELIAAVADKLRRAKPIGKMEVSFGPFKYVTSLPPEELLGHLLGLAAECKKSSDN